VKHLIIALAIVLILTAPGLISTPEAGAADDWYYDYVVRTDGDTVMWVETQRDAPHHSSICWAPIEQQQNPKCVVTDRFRGADVDGNRVVWVKDGRLHGMDITSNEPLDLPQIGGPGAKDAHPVLSGDRLAWLNQTNPDEQWRILTVDLARVAQPEVIRLVPDDVFSADWLSHLRMSQDRLLWAEWTDDQWDLWTVRFGEAPVQLRTGSRGRTAAVLNGYDIGGDFVVYGVGFWVHLIDLNDPAQERLLSKDAKWPTTDGRYVFWQGYGEEPFGYDLQTDSHIPFLYESIESGLGVSAPYARGGTVAWIGGDNDHLHVHRIRDILPSAPRPDPGKIDPAWLYFDKTGHYLSYGFKDFWLNSGGLPVFGYPLTREYDELNRDLDEFRTVQYTERQRFEYHPAYAGTPYETLLGRLGAADADRRGLDDHSAFAPVDKPTSAGIEYFEVTGHTLRSPFRDYWHRHGLEFGDAGVSYRESLALFGYPISEEFVDPDTGLTTQYFERAVFEHHPDNPDPYKVLLRLLGAEEIERRDW
jgi:hypothetical protein